jgi:hypothetical protein
MTSSPARRAFLAASGGLPLALRDVDVKNKADGSFTHVRQRTTTFALRGVRAYPHGAYWLARRFSSLSVFRLAIESATSRT